ncbi:MAG: potassium transporter TrkG [Burkholderiaceae bacterium]
MPAYRRTLLPVLNVLGLIIVIFSFTMLVPLATSEVLRDGAARSFEIACGVSLLTGLVMWLSTRSQRRELMPRDGFLLVTLVWTALPALATLPLLLSIESLSFTDAYFETMSGLTTTGSTVLSGLDDLPLSINLWRCLLVWIGGMGILVLAVAILPLLGVGGAQVFKAESTGPMKEAKLTPRIAETAKGLYAVYLTISAACFLSFAAAGMSWSDAFMHMCSTMGLGGFSSHDSSFAFWNSPLIDSVAVLFMLLAGFNFSLHFVAWRKRSLAAYWRDPEAKAYLGTMIGAVLAVTIFLLFHGVYPDFLTALRFAAFNVVSIASTTGFASTDYNLWPIAAPVFMIFLSGFVTSAGSTGGGIKMIRAVILFKQARREFTRIVHPRAVSPVNIGGQVIENNVIFAVLAFMLIYGAVIIICTFLLLISGLDVVTAFTAVVASVNNMGPGLNQVGPATNFGGLSDFETWVCTFAMLVGRIEMLAVLVLFTRGFWRA